MNARAFVTTTVLTAALALPAAAGTVAAPKPKAAGTTTHVAPADQLAILQAKNRALAEKVKALTATNRALAGEARYQTDRNVALSNWIGELNRRIAALGGAGSATLRLDPDQECRDYLVCTPEQDCRVWGNSCLVGRSLTTPVAALPANGP